jgi:hypothetical protein
VTLVPELRKKPVIADVQKLSRQPFVEVRAGRRLMAVTVECEAPQSEVEVTVTRSTLRVVSRGDPSRVNVFVALPVTAEPGRFWARFNHGVCDVLIARAHPSD